MKVFVLDNYDSFTYNLVHYLNGEGAEVIVNRNNEVDIESVHSCDKIVLSPGPGLPSDSNSLMDVIANFVGVKPILGVCLGLQAIGVHYGMELRNLSEVHHGVEHTIIKTGRHYLFQGVPVQFSAGMYHSWYLQHQSNSILDTIAVDEAGRIMALAHPEIDVCGVQFHPESIMTNQGRTIIHNWISKT